MSVWGKVWGTTWGSVWGGVIIVQPDRVYISVGVFRTIVVGVTR